MSRSGPPAGPPPDPPPGPPPGPVATPWGPRPSPAVRTALDLASAAVIATVLALVLATFRDYGITWDEIWHLDYGDFILSWFSTGGRDTSALCYRLDYMYGGTFDLLGAVIRRLSPLPEIETIHLFGALWGVIGLWGAHCLARRLGGPAAGLVAVLLLATTPVYYGHMFNNPKDLPFAVAYVWALDALAAVALQAPRVPRRAWIRLAILTGVAMGVRIAGILLLVYLVAAVGWIAWRRTRLTDSLDAGLATARRLGRPALGTIVGAWIVMIAPWPWALLDPIRRPFMALGRMSRFTVHQRTMPFAGEPMETTEPRWDYLLHYFGLKLPLLVLGLVLVAVVVVAIRVVRQRRALRGGQRGVQPSPWSRAQHDMTLLLGVAIVAPPAYAIVVRSVLYDGLRHFLFLVPVLVVVAALAAVTLPRLWTRGRRVVTLALVLGGGLLVVRQVQAMRRLHPHQYIYFNELVGGLPGAYDNYDTDYYGNSYREGFAALAAYLWHEDRQAYLQSRYRVTGCIPDFIARRYLGGNFEWVEKASKGAQFYLGYTRSHCDERHRTRPELLRIEREGTLLLLVRDLRSASEDELQDDEHRDRQRDQGREIQGEDRPKKRPGRGRRRPARAPHDHPRPGAGASEGA